VTHYHVSCYQIDEKERFAVTFEQMQLA